MEQTKKRWHFPIRIKTLLIIVVFGLILAEIAMVYFSIVSDNTNKKNYMNAANELSETVALSIDKEKTKNVVGQVYSYYEASPTKPGRDQEGTADYKAYMAQFETVRKDPDYQYLQAYLKAVKTANADTDAVYVACVDFDRKQCFYVVYDEENEYFPTGIIDPLYEEDYPMIEDHMRGFAPSIYKDEATGQYLVTAGRPILDEKGNIIAYVLVDFTMATVRSSQANAIVRLFIYLVATVILLCVLGLVIIHFILVKPIKTLSNAALSYDVDQPDATHEAFSKIRIGTHDEFYDLAEAMKTMENDIHDKIHELTEANAALSASQKVAGKMAELANKDALTGVRNKIAYDNVVNGLNEKIAKQEPLEFGLAMIDLNYLKVINDDYGHDAGDHALVKLCNIICTIFAHSPVYRFGGDEFVVLFKGKDYAEVNELVAEFEEKIDDLGKDHDLLPEEQVSAAIGYAAFEPGKDSCVDDVFKRADAAMYVRKRQMKEGQ